MEAWIILGAAALQVGGVVLNWRWMARLDRRERDLERRELGLQLASTELERRWLRQPTADVAEPWRGDGGRA